MIINLPILIIEKISYYLWRDNVNHLNREYLYNYNPTYIGSIRCVLCNGIFIKFFHYNHRDLTYTRDYGNGYFYEDQIDLCNSQYNECAYRITTRKHKQHNIPLPPRYYFSMDPPEDIQRKYESQKRKLLFVK